jgi:predicted metal-dependent peptidase
MPKVGLYSDDIYKAGNGTSDGIYNILEDDGDGDEYGGDGDPLDDCQDGGGTPAEQAQEQAEWKVRVAQAAQSAKMMGKLSANMERVVGEILQPKVDWRDVLQRFLVKCRTDNRSFARFNRRFLPQGLFLPSVSGEVMGEVLIAVDCSGSIDDKTVAQFAGEIQAIKDDMTPTKVHVVYFDSTVSHYEVYEHDDSLDIKPHGGGGTDFAPVFDYMVEHGIEPVAVVFLTDLCCNSFGIPPDCPVLWVSTEQDMSAPFGEIVEMN